MDQELLDLFVEETRENLLVLEEGLLNLESNPEKEDLINTIFRAMHTIKGGAGLVGLQNIMQLTHKLENLLEEVRQKKFSLDEVSFKILFYGSDIIKQMLDGDDYEGRNYQHEIEEVMTMLEALAEDRSQTAKKLAANQGDEEGKAGQAGQFEKYKIDLTFNSNILETGTDPLMLISELADLGNFLEVTCNYGKLPDLEELLSHEFYLSWKFILETEAGLGAIEDVFIFVMDDNDINISLMDEEKESPACETQVAEGRTDSKDIQVDKLDGQARKYEESSASLASEQTKSSTIRVDSSKLEDILNHIAELLISQSRVKDMVLSNLHNQALLTNNLSASNVAISEIGAAFEEVDKIIRIVQEKVMTTTMVPIAGTFTRYQRMIRDMAKEVNKEVRIVIEGKDTELDKQVIEQIIDPLKHLIRNSLDHGIESPEDREAAGKDREGTITMRASHQEGHVLIEIIDDGRGIDEEAIFAKAVERGIVSADENLSHQEMCMLLFKPGFSTAKKVTDISGRGVGLDVVMTNIQNLRGSVTMDSEVGHGSKVTIKLPLTLAIIDGMMVRVGQERFIIPLNMISEFIKLEDEHIHHTEGNDVFIHIRGENMAYRNLSHLINIEAESHAPTDGIVVVLVNNGVKLALMVDEILGQEQVVIKNLNENMNDHIEGIAGVTILGDGMVAIILDVPGIYKLVH